MSPDTPGYHLDVLISLSRELEFDSSRRLIRQLEWIHGYLNFEIKQASKKLDTAGSAL